MKKFFIPFATLLTPVFAFAQQNVNGILLRFRDILNTLMPILIIFAVVWFIITVIKFIMAKDDGERGEARSGIINGLIGIFVIVALWGLIAVIGNTLGIQQGGTLDSSDIPQINII